MTLSSLSDNFLRALHDEASRRGVSVDQLLEGLAQPTPAAPQHNFFENAHDPMLIFDFGGQIVAANAAYTKLLGYNPDTISGENHWGYIHPDDRLSLENKIKNIPHIEGGSAQFLMRTRRADTSYIWLEWSAALKDGLFYCTARELHRLRVLEHDLESIASKRRHTQSELRRRTQEFQAVVENTPDPISRFNREYRYIFANSANAEATGITTDRLMGKTLGEINAPDELVALIENALKKVFETGETQRIGLNFAARDGRKYYDAHLVAEYSDDGEIESVLLVSHDITAQRDLERQLRERETWYRGIVESQVDLVSRYTRDLTLVFVNDAYCKYYGGTAQEFLGKNILSMEDPKVHDTIRQHIEKMEHDSPPQVTEILSYWPDGRERWIQWVVCSVMMDENGTQLFQAVGRDITAQRQLEKQLRERESWYRGIVESQIDLVSRHLPDTTIIFVNDAYCKYYGFTREELIGQSFLITESPSVHKSLMEKLRNTLSEPGPHTEENLTYHRDGSERWVQWMSYGISDENGKVVMIQSVGRDITAQKTAERVRRENEERFRAMLEAVSEGIALIDTEGKIVILNRYIEVRFGYTRAQLEGQPLEIIFASESRKDIHTALNTARVRGTNLTMELTSPPLAISKSGRQFPIEITFVPLTLTGQPMMMCLLVDITDRLELEEQRIINRALEVELEKERELIDLKQRFTTMVTHEFRTPLAVIQSTVDIVKTYLDRLPVEKLAERLDMVTKQSKRMGELLSDILIYSRGERGLTPSILEIIDLAEFCQNIIEDLQMADAESHPVTLTIENSPLILRTDRRLLEHICLNLIGNAIKYSPPESPVEVKVTRQDTILLLIVTDHGIGIPETDLPRIYTPFHRASNVGSRSGSGLGLPIVKQCVDALSGTIEATSRIGHGTTFTVYLPESITLG